MAKPTVLPRSVPAGLVLEVTNREGDTWRLLTLEPGVRQGRDHAWRARVKPIGGSRANATIYPEGYQTFRAEHVQPESRALFEAHLSGWKAGHSFWIRERDPQLNESSRRRLIRKLAREQRRDF